MKTYLYVTESYFLCLSKRKNFSFCLNNRFICLEDLSTDNPMTVEIVYRFYEELVKDRLFTLIFKNRTKGRLTNFADQKAFLQKFGLSERYLNQEYSTIQTKYDQYFVRINDAYTLLEECVMKREGSSIKTEEQECN